MAIAATVTAILVSAGHPVAVAQDIDRDHGTTVDMGASPAIDGGLGDVRPNAEAGAQALPDLAAGPDRPDNGGALELPLGLVLPETMPSPGPESTDGMDADYWTSSPLVIVNMGSRKCLELGAINVNGRPTLTVFQNTCRDVSGQKWYMVMTDTGTSEGMYYYFHTGGVCLRSLPGSAVGWSLIKDCGTKDYRVLWRLSLGVGVYGTFTSLKNVDTGRFLSSPNATNGAKPVTTSDHRGYSSGWLIYTR